MSAQQAQMPLEIFDVEAPLAQAERCLVQWLQEEGRRLPQRQCRQAAALMARYFMYEDDVTDALMLSFLRHYAGFRAIDMDDPASVRHALKTVLDQSVVTEPSPPASFLLRGYVLAAAVFVFLFCSLLYARTLWVPVHISTVQQAALKERVEKITTLDSSVSHAAVWARVKAPYAIRSYRHLPVKDYPAVTSFLDQWIDTLDRGETAGSVSRARM